MGRQVAGPFLGSWMMDGALDWMEQLGNASWRSREKKKDPTSSPPSRGRGALSSDAQQQVTAERQGIVIEPANPEFIYPPVYEPGHLRPVAVPTTRHSIFLQTIKASVSRCLSV